MQGTTRRRVDQPWLVVLHALAVLSLLGLALLGQVPAEVAGWLVLPTVAAGRVRGSPARWGCAHPGLRAAGRAGWRALGDYLLQSWRPVLLRSLLLWGLWAWSGEWGWSWLRLVPWALWLWRGVGLGWPRVRQQAAWLWVAEGLWQTQRLVLLGYLGVVLSQQRSGGQALWGVGLGCLVCQQDESRVGVARQADGSYQATLCGHFTLTVAGDHPFRMRLLVLFLSLLDAPGATRGSRRTRDGRTPVVRQLQLAEWFGVPQPDISRWLKYWQTADWANLLSLHSAEVLTAELVVRIVEVCATFPTWGVARVYQHLRQQGLAVTEPQVQQAVAQSGWRRLQQTLSTRYDLSGPGLAFRDGWLVGQLLGQIRALLDRLEAGQPLPSRSAHHAGRLNDAGQRGGAPATAAREGAALAVAGGAGALGGLVSRD